LGDTGRYRFNADERRNAPIGSEWSQAPIVFGKDQGWLLIEQIDSARLRHKQLGHDIVLFFYVTYGLYVTTCWKRLAQRKPTQAGSIGAFQRSSALKR